MDRVDPVGFDGSVLFLGGALGATSDGLTQFDPIGGFVTGSFVQDACPPGSTGEDPMKAGGLCGLQVGCR